MKPMILTLALLMAACSSGPTPPPMPDGPVLAMNPERMVGRTDNDLMTAGAVR